MNQDFIAEISIDSLGRLHVRPASASFPQVWRAAMEVNWDESSKTLFSPTPRELAYDAWFLQILAAAKDEYGCTLEISPSTSWVGVPPVTKQSIVLASRNEA